MFVEHLPCSEHCADSRDTAMDRDVLSIVLELDAQQKRQMLNKLKFNGI